MSTQATTDRWWDAADRDTVHAAAVSWLTRLNNPEVSLEETLAWQKWMQQDPRHAQAFTRMEELSQTLRQVKQPPQPNAWELRRDRYDASVPLSAWSARRSNVPFALAASLALITACILWSQWPAAQVFTTQVGQNRSVTLSDGSKVTLGGDTRIEVALDTSTRTIKLTRGEAFFAVAKDPVRPFQVRAGGAQVIAVGTAFNVRHGRDRVVVAVLEGQVRVEPFSTLVPTALLREFKPLKPVRVAAGEQTAAGGIKIEPARRLENPAAAISWQTGRLAFHLQPLREVLEDVNRYAPKPIEIADENIGSLIITGTITHVNMTGWIESLERGFELQSVEEPNRIILRRRGPHSAPSPH